MPREKKVHYKDLPQMKFTSRTEFRIWLSEHSTASDGIWLIRDSPTFSYAHSVEEALCFGWIDSQVGRTRDTNQIMQYFCPRRPGSIWSRLNKTRIERLVSEGKMHASGMDKIEAAKADGSWEKWDDVEDGIPPGDLKEALEGEPRAMAAFNALGKTKKKSMLNRLLSLKRPASRQARISSTIDELLALNKDE